MSKITPPYPEAKHERTSRSLSPFKVSAMLLLAAFLNFLAFATALPHSALATTSAATATAATATSGAASTSIVAITSSASSTGPTPSGTFAACLETHPGQGISNEVFNNYALTACKNFFHDGQRTLSTNASTTVHFNYTNQHYDPLVKDTFFNVLTFTVAGTNISTMGMGGCEYAFTSTDAWDSNAKHEGRICTNTTGGLLITA
jgi:hypothetical protein